MAALAALAASHGCNGEATRPTDRELEPLTTLDAGMLAIGVPAGGLFALDPRSRSAAAEFPAGERKHVLSGAGLWLSARTADGEQSSIVQRATEFVPGTVGGDPADPRFRVYKVTDGDDETAPDVAAWPRDLGAPVDAGGRPLVPDDGQIIWTLYHDARPAAHTILGGDGIGAEVRQSLFGWSAPVELVRVVLVRWRITNRSGGDWEALYTGFWADAELGGATDDLCGSDSTLGLAFVYNGRDLDGVYSTQPPAAGIALVAVRDSTGSLPLERSVNIWLNGEDPQTEAQARHILRARRFNGAPNPERYLYPGKPELQVPGGMLDPVLGDKRMLVAAGPFRVAAGDWIELDGIVAASQSPGMVPRLASVRTLRSDLSAALATLIRQGWL